MPEHKKGQEFIIDRCGSVVLTGFYFRLKLGPRFLVNWCPPRAHTPALAELPMHSGSSFPQATDEDAFCMYGHAVSPKNIVGRRRL